MKVDSYITYYSAEAYSPLPMFFPLRAIQALDAVQEGNKAELLLHFSDTDAALQFWAANGVYWANTMQAEWLGELDPSEVP